MGLRTSQWEGLKHWALKQGLRSDKMYFFPNRSQKKIFLISLHFYLKPEKHSHIINRIVAVVQWCSPTKQGEAELTSGVRHQQHILKKSWIWYNTLLWAHKKQRECGRVVGRKPQQPQRLSSRPDRLAQEQPSQVNKTNNNQLWGQFCKTELSI